MLQPTGQRPQTVGTFCDLPRPRLEAVLRRGQRADRAELDHVAGERRRVGLDPRRSRSPNAEPRLTRDRAGRPRRRLGRSACSGSRGCSARGRARSSARSGSASRTCASGSASACCRARSGTSRSCSGHSPPLSQTGQSSGWLTRMNSSVASCASAAIARGARASSRPSRPRRSACSRPAASACPGDLDRGTCGRRRPARRAAARSRRRESRSRPQSAASTSPVPFGTVDLALVDR